LAIIDDWIVRHGLRLAHAKTEAIMHTKNWAFSNPVFSIGGHNIEARRETRYLSFILDSDLTFTSHLKQASAQASSTAVALGRLMPNLSGPSQTKRSLLMEDSERTVSSVVIRNTGRDLTINQWQTRWNNSEKASWTRSILPNLRWWLKSRPWTFPST